MLICKNCGHLVDQKFCPSCGQRVSIDRIRFSSILGDISYAVLNLDRGFFYNLVALFRRPGYAIKEYLDGKRRKYYHPLSYLLVVLAAMLIAMNFLEVHYYDPVQDASMSSERTEFWKEYDQTQQMWIRYYKYFIPFYLPWMGLIYYGWLRLLKAKYNYWECLVISFFVSAQMTIPQIIILVLVSLFGSTAFARTSDMIINNAILIVLYYLQFYQLGSDALRPGRRAALSILGAAAMLAFVYAAIFGFLGFAKWIGL
ncbi:MAG: DUF3667 domain-containing protein [Cyclobacteriaceae bacterium]|nr:DUF3667 domain-containing protein [Cyclobacteriaceae bacterium]